MPQGGCPKPPYSSTQLKWWTKALKRLCQVNACQLLLVASVEHVTSTGMSSISWFMEMCPPVLSCAQSGSYCPLLLLLHRLWAKKHPRAAGTEGTCRSCQCLSLNISSVIPCLQLYTHARSPSLSHLELVLGFCPYCKHTEGFTLFVRGQISVVLGWEAWWVSQDL